MNKLAAAVPIVLGLAFPGRAEEVVLREALVIGPLDRQGRGALHVDRVESQIVHGELTWPTVGAQLTLASGATATWQAAQAGDDGWIRHGALGNGYAAIAVTSDRERMALLQASGHALVYVNGEPRVGDPYQYGYVSVPIVLRSGTNHLLFRCQRGGALLARLVDPPAPVFIDARDATLPDLVVGESRDLLGALLVVNATTSMQEHLVLRAAGAAFPLPPIAPLAWLKAPFSMRLQAPASEGMQAVIIEVGHGSDPEFLAAHSAAISLAIKQPSQVQKRTFVSAIDGSVQYYALNPCSVTGPAERPALVLSLHGAGVEATGQAAAYASKRWAHIVAPTNRRPYGFDWEDWGRLDALEVVDVAARELGTDPARVYLTGHSMGGHGTWQIGVLAPDRFAALGPSAAWASFLTYGGMVRRQQAASGDAVFARAAGASDTESLLTNCAQQGIYILHGDADDNVPVTEARSLKKRLDEFHNDVVAFEQPGAGHWWDASPEPGVDCVDWAPMFDLFARHRLPAEVRTIDFKTANPGASSRCYWLRVITQLEPLAMSSVHARCEPGQRQFAITTENIAQLSIDPAPMLTPGAAKVVIDGDAIETSLADRGVISLERESGHWRVAVAPARGKRPERYGPFKQVFQNRPLLVYGTHGSSDENAWALAKARFDAETFWYRGNGTLELMADSRFDPAREPNRNVILYGNSATNAAWAALLDRSPVQVRPGEVQVGQQHHRGQDLACLEVRPRPDSEIALVGAVAGSGVAGMRLADRLAYFTSGVGYPDWLVLSSRSLEGATDGLVALGIFGPDWSLR